MKNPAAVAPCPFCNEPCKEICRYNIKKLAVVHNPDCWISLHTSSTITAFEGFEIPSWNRRANPAVALGRLGGAVKSAAKTRAAKRNIIARWAKEKARKANRV